MNNSEFYLKIFQLSELADSELSERQVDNLLQCLKDLDHFLKSHSLPEYLADEANTNIAVALTKFLSRAGMLTVTQLKQVVLLRDFLVHVWYRSGFRGGRSPLKIVLTQTGSTSTLARSTLVNIFCFLPLEVLPNEWMQLSKFIPEEIHLPLVLSYVVQVGMFGDNYSSNLKALFEDKRLFLTELSSEFLPMAMVAWMHVSYLESPLRYSVKRFLNGLLRKKINAPYRAEASKIEPREPHLGIVLELMNVGHAMGRIYYEKIKTLSQKFKITLIAMEGTVSDEILNQFDNVIVDFEKESFGRVIDRISKLNLTAVYFPSVGMSPLGIILANTRVAPLQILGTGHPDTTVSEFMDCAILNLEHDDFDLPEISKYYSERLLTVERYEPSYRLPVPISAYVECGEELNEQKTIAINCKHMKLSPSFLSALKAISSELSGQVHFQFFPGVWDEHARCGLEKKLMRLVSPNVRVEPNKPYGEFIKVLAKCDMALTPFPFGNTNSTVDILCIGLPTVVLQSEEIRASGDKRLLRHFGLERFLVDNIDDYVRCALDILREVEPTGDRTQRVRLYDNKKILKFFGNDKHYDYLSETLINYLI